MKTDNIYIKPFLSIESENHVWYKNLKFLGKGGNGTAFLVLCTSGENMGGIFTLKILHKISDDNRIAKFQREINYMQEHPHPSIMREYDQGVWEGHPFVVMDHMTTTLETLVQAGEIELYDCFLYILQLLSAVKHLHSTGYIHRDIKPSNIFIKDSAAILGDYGLIKKVEVDNNNCDNDTIKGYIAMPFYYRTPELVAYAKGEDNPSFESDLFQLGLVIAYIFTRQNVLMEAKIIDEPIRVKPFSIHRGKYSGKIKYALNGMLNIDKEKRWDLDKTYKYFSKLFMEYAKDDLELNGKQ